MHPAELTDARLNGYSSAESGINQVANSWVSPIVPTGSSPADDQTVFTTSEDEHLFQPAEESDLHQILRGSESQRKRIVGTAAVVALAVVALTYNFWPAAGEKEKTETAEASKAVQSAPVVPVQTAWRIPERSPAGSTAVAWPDLPPSATVEPSHQVMSAASAGNTAVRQTAPPWENHGIVLVQRPGVNIRSTPSANGIVVATAPKGTRFTATDQQGDWVRVESGPLKGWINSQFLAAN
jgi:hypothetical protein